MFFNEGIMSESYKLTNLDLNQILTVSLAGETNNNPAITREKSLWEKNEKTIIGYHYQCTIACT